MRSFDELPDELQMRVARMLLRDDPLDVGRLVSSSRALGQLAHGDNVEAAELRAARTLTTQQRLSELRVLAGREEQSDVPVLQRLLPGLDAPPELAWAPPEPVTRLVFGYRTEWRVADGKERSRAVARVLRVSGSLAHLWLSKIKIGDEGAKVLAEAIRASGSLAELYLGGNGLSDEGIKALVAGVAASSSLTKLDLQDSAIGDVGAKAIAEAIGASSSLAELKLDGNSIGDEGAKALAAGVAASGSMALLDLNHNNIGDEGAKALAAAVAASGSMTLMVCLDSNNTGADAKQSMRDAVQGRQGFFMIL